MDFFEHQDVARRKTGQLVLLFMLGVVATLIAVNLLCFIGYWIFYTPTEVSYSVDQSQIPSVFKSFLSGADINLSQRQSGFLRVWTDWWGSNLNWQISLGVLAAVIIGTVFRYFELAGGGHKVAQWAGATAVDMSTKDPSKKQFINVCEEMSIAAGMPIPDLYVMEREDGINAFVAGYDSDEAVLVVTQGALNSLSRDQLQGVIGHEYSHILNGDMRLNVRLMSFLAGLVMIGQIGRFLIDSHWYSGRSYRSGRGGSTSKSGFIVIGLGAVLALVGYIGVLVGRMIKAAVSRQREFLADASSVQFTRNPDGLSGALYAIKEHQEGSQLRHRHAEDMSHFCFGESVALSDRLATHPPVLDRIKRINPHFVAKERTKRRETESAEKAVSRSQPQAFQTALLAAGIAGMVGQSSPEHVDYARSLYQHIPERVKNWVHTSNGARAFLYSQVLLGNPDDQQKILDAIKEEDPSVLEALKPLWPFTKQMDPQLRLPVLELALSTLKRLDETTKLIFVDRLERLVLLDQRIDFIEWVTVAKTKMKLTPKKRQKNEKLKSQVHLYYESLNVLFNVFVSLNPDSTKSIPSYEAICSQIGMTPKLGSGLSDIGFEKFDKAIQNLDSISFMWRKMILQSCADIVQSNGQIAFREYEALRIVAECLDCPMPPLMTELEPSDERDQPIPFE
jgi:Zn-dependent protease with chaperone function